jgi:glycine/D-amino acid oxidase-like deaminating enzyme
LNVLVVGAGVFGAWSAWQLTERGHRVTLIDAYGPANARASSADHSRVIRCGYGGDAIYSQWAHAAFDDWHWLSGETRRRLVEEAGALFMGAAPNSYIEATHHTLTSLDLRCELFSPEEVERRYPQIDADGVGPSLFEPGAGVIRARAAVQALVELMTRRQHVEYQVSRVARADETLSVPRFTSAEGTQFSADAYVFACGPWLPSIFPHAVGGRVRASRQEILHFGVPPGDDRFSLKRLPVWIDFDAGLYGIPDFDARGFKVGIDRHGPPIDPDCADRVVDMSVVDDTRGWLARRFPDLRDAPLVDAHVCQYENTRTGDFIIDRHPAWPNVWIVGGGSGHGFKHGPSVGRYVAKLVDGAAVAEPRFALATKRTNGARAVY